MKLKERQPNVPKNPCDYMEVGSKAKFVGHFSPVLSSFANRGLRTRAAWAPLELTEETKKERCTEGQCNTGLGAYGATRPQYQSTIFCLF
jgi:hypothetical protein